MKYGKMFSMSLRCALEPRERQSAREKLKHAYSSFESVDSVPAHTFHMWIIKLHFNVLKRDPPHWEISVNSNNNINE